MGLRWVRSRAVGGALTDGRGRAWRLLGRLKRSQTSARAWRVRFAIAAMLMLAGCDRPEPPTHLRIAGADPERGRLLIARYKCGACHRIPGVRGAAGVVGPPLTNYARRVLLAGIVPNAPRTL